MNLDALPRDRFGRIILGPSIYHGIFWDMGHQRWRVRITLVTHHFYIGHFRLLDEVSAARAYDNAAWWLQDFKKPGTTKLNFPEDPPRPMLPKVRRARAIALALEYPRYRPPFPDFVAPPDDAVWPALPPSYRV